MPIFLSDFVSRFLVWKMYVYCSSALWSEAYDIPWRPDFASKVDGWDIFFHKAKVVKSQEAAVDGKDR